MWNLSLSRCASKFIEGFTKIHCLKPHLAFSSWFNVYKTWNIKLNWLKLAEILWKPVNCWFLLAKDLYRSPCFVIQTHRTLSSYNKILEPEVENNWIRVAQDLPLADSPFPLTQRDFPPLHQWLDSNPLPMENSTSVFPIQIFSYTFNYISGEKIKSEHGLTFPNSCQTLTKRQL